MQKEHSESRHRERIKSVCRVLKIFCVFVMVFYCYSEFLVVTAPVVQVTPLYTDPNSPRPIVPENDAEIDTEEVWPTGEIRMVLNLTEGSPSLLNFSYLPGPSTLREDREWLGRTVAFLFFLYYIIGGVLFFRLFQSYERVRIFEIESVHKLKWVGFWLIGLFIIRQLYEFSKLLWSQDSQSRLIPVWWGRTVFRCFYLDHRLGYERSMQNGR